MEKSSFHAPQSPSSSSDLKLATWGVLLELALLAFWTFSGAWRGSWRLIAGFLLPGTIYCLAAWWVLRLRPTPATFKTRALLMGFAALFLFTLLLTPSPLSNDVYRYLWDGKLLSQGINPYQYPPGAAELAPYRDGNWGLIFNRDVPTGYPPLAEALFAMGWRINPDPMTLRAMAALASLGASWFLMRSLAAAGLEERRAMLYAWSPLVALEFANSGHLDAYALLFLSAALLLALKNKFHGAAICLALGGLVKFFPILLLPAWGRRWSKTAWLACGLVFCLPWLPFLAGGTPFTGLGIFASRGDFNNSLYRLIEQGWYLALGSSIARLWARGSISILLALVALAWLLRRPAVEGAQESVLAGWRSAGALFGLSLVLSPVVHPWYVCWMLAFITITSASPGPWLALSVTMIFARQVYIGYELEGVWQEAWWPPLAVWIPFYLALGVAFGKRFFYKGKRLLALTFQEGVVRDQGILHLHHDQQIQYHSLHRRHE